jgi:hypothetical protein
MNIFFTVVQVGKNLIKTHREHINKYVCDFSAGTIFYASGAKPNM